MQLSLDPAATCRGHAGLDSAATMSAKTGINVKESFNQAMTRGKSDARMNQVEACVAWGVRYPLPPKHARRDRARGGQGAVAGLQGGERERGKLSRNLNPVPPVYARSLFAVLRFRPGKWPNRHSFL